MVEAVRLNTFVEWLVTRLRFTTLWVVVAEANGCVANCTSLVAASLVVHPISALAVDAVDVIELITGGVTSAAGKACVVNVFWVLVAAFADASADFTR